MKSKSETALKAAILAALARIGVVAWNSPAGQIRARRGYVHLAPRGTADIVGYMPDGRLVGLEVKLPNGRVSPEQEAWRERAARAGCVVAVVRSVAEAVDVVRCNARKT